jgi:uncharacterized protein (DUF2267 family)
VDEDDLLARVQSRARLYGRNQSRRAVGAVVAALDGSLPAGAVRQIAAQLPAGIRRAMASPNGTSPHEKPDAGRGGFLARIAGRLLIDGPDAAFLARVVFEQLNAAMPRKRPAAFAHLACPDLRALLCARVESDPSAIGSAAPGTVIRRTVTGFPPVRKAAAARLAADTLPPRSRNWAPARTRAST